LTGATVSAGRGRCALVVFAHPDGASLCATLAHAAVRGLERGGAQVVLVDLYADGFVPAMSAAERRVYESDQPILDPLVRRYADLVKWCDTLVVVYPTWNMGMPAILKGWFERVFVAGVAFALPTPGSTILGGLNHITRFVGVSTYGAPRVVVRLTTDHGRRLLTRCVRLMSTRPGRRTRWLGLYGLNTPTPPRITGFIGRVERGMERL
jgi:NAD(P)H dehydrogenase (quinone)